MTLPTSNLLDKISKAIATAEGFYKRGSRPARNHNPGDLTRDFIGKNIAWDGEYPIFSNDEDGFANLRYQVSLMFNGSRFYNPEMTIAEISKKYTATEQDAWAANVAKYLGCSVDTKLKELFISDDVQNSETSGPSVKP